MPHESTKRSAKRHKISTIFRKEYVLTVSRTPSLGKQTQRELELRDHKILLIMVQISSSADSCAAPRNKHSSDAAKFGARRPQNLHFLNYKDAQKSSHKII